MQVIQKYPDELIYCIIGQKIRENSCNSWQKNIINEKFASLL